VVSERKWVDDRVAKVIALKNEVCKEGESFVVVNQKGIDPNALDQLAAHGVIALRRAKKRNMERLALACGGNCCNSIDDMCAADLGYAGSVYEQVLGEDKFTFVEDVANPFSCTIMVKGPHTHVIAQVKAAIRDGLHAVKNVIEDKFVVAGAGAFELAAHRMLYKYRDTVEGRAKLGVQAFADALLVIPKVLSENAGFDPNDTVLKLEDKMSSSEGFFGVDLSNGEAMDPSKEGIYDNYRVKRQMIDSSAIISTQLLLVDEVMRAGRQIKK